MFNTGNTQDHDPDILQMGLVVSDAEVNIDLIDNSLILTTVIG